MAILIGKFLLKFIETAQKYNNNKIILIVFFVFPFSLLNLKDLNNSN